MIDFTTYLAIDREHLRELATVWPTWMKFKPEIRQRPLIVSCDADADIRNSELLFLDHPNLTLYDWDYEATTQRAKMLAAFVLQAPRLVKTPWLLKLDTDLYATKEDIFWCSEGLTAGNPVFISNPWGYTKPATAIQTLDNWGDTVPELSKFPRLNFPFDPQGRSVSTPGRIISWCFFGRTDWCQWAASLCKNQLPLPSHDTYLWYVAKRSGAHFSTLKMKNFGWEHRRVK